MNGISLSVMAAVLVGMIGPAAAATVSGFFYITAINAQNQTSEQSQATVEVAQDAFNLAYAGSPGYAYADFEYTGDLDFGTDNGDDTTIAGWLATGVNGTVTNLDPAFGALPLSKGNLADGTATSTFFVLTQSVSTGPANYTLTHDDGFSLYALTDVRTLVGSDPGPGTVRTTKVPGFTGGILAMVYVATNSDPSILKVEVAPVPLPATLPLCAAGLGGLVLLRHLRRAA
jgi:type II secretory pathway pseudopilin PulG